MAVCGLFVPLSRWDSPSETLAMHQRPNLDIGWFALEPELYHDSCGEGVELSVVVQSRNVRRSHHTAAQSAPI